MTISIIIPAYNVEAYLEDTLQSVLQQTYLDIEVILVDDGSTDQTGRICDEYALQDKRIRVIHKENGGLSDARNAGIKIATGEYIHFLDGDDTYTGMQTLSELVSKLTSFQKPDLLLFCRIDKFNNRNVPERIYDTEQINGTLSPVEVFGYLISQQRFNMSACFQLIRRDILLTHKIFFTKNLRNEDIDWSLMLWQHITSVKATNIHGYIYNHHANSITTTFGILDMESYLWIFRKWTKICKTLRYNPLYKYYLYYLAFLYPTICYHFLDLTIKQQRKYLKSMHQMSDVLQYSHTQKSNRICKISHYIGLTNTIYIMAFYGKIKHTILKFQK